MSESEDVDDIFANPPERIDRSLLEEPSELVKASPHLMELWRYGYPVQRLEHLAQCALLLARSESGARPGLLEQVLSRRAKLAKLGTPLANTVRAPKPFDRQTPR
jgi:hypothetical protein